MNERTALDAARAGDDHAPAEERRRLEAAVREQAALLDKASDAILTRDLEHKITYWNLGAQRLYGYSAAEALGRSVLELIYDDRATFDEATARVLAEGEWMGELQHVARDGRALTVHGRWTLVRDDAGAPTGILVINSDITERKRFEAQLLRAQRMESIGTLAGGIAHDLNNVLGPILLSIEMLKELKNDAAGDELLSMLQVSTQRGADLVKQVLSFARGMEGQRIAVNPLHLMRELLQVLRETLPKTIEVDFRRPRDPWMVIGDPTQLHQVFLNLCVNARDAMPAGGRLTVGMENVVFDETYAAMFPDARPGAYALVKVADTGTGVAPEIRERIFEPFFTTKVLGAGTGLGLSTALSIIKGHGGFIQLHGEPGSGSTFEVYLPADPEQSALAETAAAPEPRLPRGNGELVLVVDDEESIRMVARRTLERFGYRVALAHNGAEAVAVFARRRGEIAVVLTDMAMPVMDGAALIKALRFLEPSLRIVASSGFVSDGEAATALGDVRHFVPKPYTAESLLHILREVLSQ